MKKNNTLFLFFEYQKEVRLHIDSMYVKKTFLFKS